MVRHTGHVANRGSAIRSRLAGVVLAPLRWLNAGMRRLAEGSHWLQYKAEGGLLGEVEWFDHEVDLYWQWPRRARSEFLDRGVLMAASMGPDDRVLELCSGDGFYAQRFYAPRARTVLALDHNAHAVRYARRVHSASNVRYEIADIAREMPAGPFEHVVWNGALSHFTATEIAYVLSSSATALVPAGLLCGFIDVDPDAVYGYTKIRLADAADLAAHLTPHFAHVAVLESQDQVRRNLHFFASDDRAAILLSEDHPAVSWWSRERAATTATGRFARDVTPLPAADPSAS